MSAALYQLLAGYEVRFKGGELQFEDAERYDRGLINDIEVSPGALVMLFDWMATRSKTQDNGWQRMDLQHPELKRIVYTLVFVDNLQETEEGGYSFNYLQGRAVLRPAGVRTLDPRVVVGL